MKDEYNCNDILDAAVFLIIRMKTLACVMTYLFLKTELGKQI